MSTLDPPSGEVTPRPSAASRLWRTVSLFLPSQVREASKEGLLQTLIYVVLLVTVVPLLGVLLAAFWLSIAKDYVRLDFVQSLRNSYIRSIQEGFSMDELVARELDYVQFIAVDLQPADEPVNFPIYLQPRQHAQIALTEVWPNSPHEHKDDCRPDFKESTLVVVSLGGLTTKNCGPTTEGPCVLNLNEAWWNDKGQKMEEQERMPQLTIARASALANKCEEVEVRGRIMVYKNIFPESGAPDQHR